MGHVLLLVRLHIGLLLLAVLVGLLRFELSSCIWNSECLLRLPRCSQTCSRFELLICELSGCLLTGNGLILLPCLLLSFEILQEIVELFLRCKLLLLLLFVLLYTRRIWLIVDYGYF